MKIRDNKGGTTHLVIILVIVIIVAGGLLGYRIWNDNKTKQVANENVEIIDPTPEPTPTPTPKQVQIFQGNDRPIAVMIDNHDDARPQVSINDAIIVYEIIVEGGYTRLMPVFKGVNLDEIGPIRSGRHYFIDYAMENDAIYVHFGASPQAERDESRLNVDYINGIYQSESDFWRTKGKYAPHNVLTTTETILRLAENRGYSTTSESKSLLNYIADDVDLEDGMSAIDIKIPFSTSERVEFQYDEENMVYTKYANGKKQYDWRSETDTVFKNIIITFIENYTLIDDEDKGRQGIYNVGTRDGYYITNGKAIEITCEKPSREEQTVYRDLNGNEIKVSDGNTYIGIVPINANVVIEGMPEPEEEYVE